MLNKVFVNGLMLLFLITAAAAPKRAEAVVGGAMCLLGGAGVPLVVIGGAAVGTGALTTLLASATSRGEWDNFVMGIGGVFLMLGGIVLLDEEQGREIAFSDLTADRANALGLNLEQMNAYNSELSEINAIRESIQANIIDRARAGEEITAAMVQSQWQQYRNEVTPEAFDAVARISDAVLETVLAQ